MPRHAREVLDLLVTAARGLRELVYPADCVGCGRDGMLLCLVCAPRLPPFTAAQVDELPVLAAAPYDGGVREALIAYKEHDRRELAGVLGALLRRALTSSGAALVPIPSAPEAVRRRGGDHVRRLARAAARGTGRPVLGALTLRRTVRDSAGLGIAERRSNLAGAFAACPPPEPGTAAIVVDDILTTGATLHEAVRALRLAGWRVGGAAVVAATPRRSTARPLAGPR